MSNSTASQVLKLYRQMMKAGSQFPIYSYRAYALRRIKDAFKENKTVTDPDVINQLISKANHNLEIIKRQVALGHVYHHPKLIIETLPNQKKP
ncbi:LYR motif-containing protein 4 [Trichoplax sp. H2]|uniref:Complex 1 LYR protein domain-containing protein n=1 Tax=Trichoplax adhaerens TaxID=10228 RepID=B3S7F9_TRIAD|nr:hypothetical protein TRIADDRAFT_30723 [Trichoplax adhaerens]EDV21281.1 hypothetical protein TRIADDRAFT_30723 [Trichoplax adhaerens]RDD47686.1 LYR motif-containing protein 4 [Trichoplax sp. H2]|eukprot:XP_002116248.1 hypothetical protein TRIADDRAFT_30723 [Trichoplax adhaerens]